MKKIVKHMLVLAAALLLILGTVATPVQAVQTEPTFRNFAELKALTEETYDTLTWARYTGSGVLTIAEDLTIPDKLCLDLGSGFSVPKDVTLDSASKQCTNLISGQKVSVEGVLSCDLLEVESSLQISGSLKNRNAIYLEDAQLSGADRIIFTNSWSRVYTSKTVTDLDSLKEGIAQAADAPDDRWQYGLNLEKSDIQIEESLTVPENCTLVLDDPNREITVTVAEGCILDLKGEAIVSEAVVMEGILVNRKGLQIDHVPGGSLIMAENSYYLGHGPITVCSSVAESAGQLLPGLKLTDFAQEKMEDGWILTYLPSHELEDFTAEKTEATCTAPGFTTYTCTHCDAAFTAHPVLASEHSYKKEVTTPTCAQGGYTLFTCTVCGHSYQGEETAPTGQHSYQDGVCSVCGHKSSGEQAETTPMYRLYNPNSGEHFYTGSTKERDGLVEAGWQYEGVSWNAPVKGGAPVYRVYNPNSGDHHYTVDQKEVDMLVEAGWQYEGVCWNTASPENVPLYRLWNPNADCGSHHYTSSTEERDQLVDLGWILEGIGWYGMLK